MSEPSQRSDGGTASAPADGPVRFIVDERLDYNHFGPLRQSYVVASSYRCGSQYLCWRLWQTGLLGAPSEVLNPTSEQRVLMNRFKVSSAADYIAELVARRTSKNGVFGIKAHFHHFEAFLKDYPPLLEVLSPISYIYINRNDKVAQAVSMAKALQTDWWTSRMEEGPKPQLRYDRDMITHCMADIEQQDLTWREWFEAHGVVPFLVTYDELTADADGVVRAIVRLLGVENDEPDAVDVPPARKQADETNQEWIERYRRETGGASQAPAAAKGGAASVAAGAAPPATGRRHFVERYDRLVKSIPTAGATATGFLEAIRARRRHDAIVGRNRTLFEGARVLDIMSGYGFWSLAALDAGADYVVGIEPQREPIEAARKSFGEYGIDAEAYEFVNADIFAALRRFEPGEFDVVLCQEWFEHCNGLRLFQHLERLQPRHVILDTGIVIGEGPILRFTVGIDDLLGTPNHQMIMQLCDAHDFSWRLVDWNQLGITDWTGIHEYERGHRRTYVLSRLDDEPEVEPEADFEEMF
ncbi:MAG TPA: Stf0 family sulfotransferase [Stellaceae bacterium]|nr:Stf0 family sulfotransferase [Stellaceae bacterium]